MFELALRFVPQNEEAQAEIEKVQGYLATNPELLNAGDENGYTPIHAAASYGHHELIRLLLDAGADVHQRDKYETVTVANHGILSACLLQTNQPPLFPSPFSDGDTPLHHCDMPQTAEFLISLGASPEAQNDEGNTPPMAHLDNEEEAMVRVSYF